VLASLRSPARLSVRPIFVLVLVATGRLRSTRRERVAPPAWGHAGCRFPGVVHHFSGAIVISSGPPKHRRGSFLESRHANTDPAAMRLFRLGGDGMVKRVFAVASVTAVAGFVAAVTAAGCSSTTLDPSDAALSQDVKREGNRLDGSTVDTCYPTEPIEFTRFIYKPPVNQPGACAKADVDKLLAYIDKNADATFADLQKEIATYPAACAACIIGDINADQWTPLLTRDGSIVSINSSGCVELASNRGDACGKAHRQWDQCIDEGCLNCSDAELDTCQSEVQRGACLAATEALAEGCGNSINAYLEECRRFDRWITKQCVTGVPTDGGTDGGADADAD
jgi:hypothetical protein